MKAAVYNKYGPPDVVTVQDVDKPIPGDNDILVRIKSAAVTATDVIMRQGKPFLARSASGFLKPKLRILGTEAAGEVESVGAAVTRVKPGDPIYFTTSTGFATHAEFISLPENTALAIKPANLTFEEAAGVMDGGLTALPFLRDIGKLHPGQRVLVNGASGSVGTSAVQIAKYLGAEVTGVCSTANVDLVKSLGTDHVIDYTKEDFTRSGKTWDIVFDTVGKSSFSRCRPILEPHGIYMTTVLSPRILLDTALTAKSRRKKAAITFTGLRKPEERSKDLEWLRERIEAGDVKAITDRTYPLDQIVEAHRYVDTGHKVGSVVVTMNDSF